VPGRTAAIVAVLAVVVGIGVVSLAAPAPPPAPATATADGVAVAPVDASTSSLFCATGAGTDAGAGATTTVVLTNSTDAPVAGVASTVSTTGAAPVLTRVDVPARGGVSVAPSAGSPATASATTFTFAGGGVTGTAVVAGPQGWSTAPCASQVSPQWDFVGGATATGLLDLSLYNPTAAAVVADVTFLTGNGTVIEPQAYQGISLPPGRLAVEGLGAYVQDQSVVATLVQATSGSLVATELDQMVVPAGSGLALLPGSPGPVSTWRFAQTTVVQGGSVTLDVANPSPAPVTAEVSAVVPGASVVPRAVTVPGRTVGTVTVSSIAGWPLGSPYSLTVSASGPVVVGRTVAAPSGSASPQGGITAGSTTPASSWLVVAPGVPGRAAVAGGTVNSLAIADPGSSPVGVSVTRLGGGSPAVTFQVAAGGLLVLGPARVGGLHPLVVTATGPVAVLANEAPTGAPGVASTTGFPLTG
jgi:hypothetical protein